jgi:hypothetical protein
MIELAYRRDLDPGLPVQASLLLHVNPITSLLSLRVTAWAVAGSADGPFTVSESASGATRLAGEGAERADTLLIAVTGGAGNGGPPTP